jgi:hypothetical protein
MRLHFYTGIAMSLFAADAAASSAESETALERASTNESWVAPMELSETAKD